MNTPSKHFSTLRKRRFWRLLRALMLLLSLSLLIGCDTVYERPTDTTIPTVPTGDIPTSKPSSTTSKKRVAITFDDGPRSHQKQTQRIVAELAKYGFTATFFVVGNRIEKDGTLPYAVEHGCEIGIHGFTHSKDKYFDTCSDEDYEYEISKTAEEIHKQLPNYNIKLMRPVGGFISPERVSASPYSVILWDVDSQDWQNTYYSGISDENAAKKVNNVVNNVMSSVTDGSIILLHDIYESTYDATKIILQRLYDEGYDVVSVSELLGESLMPGRQYSRK